MPMPKAKRPALIYSLFWYFPDWVH